MAERLNDIPHCPRPREAKLLKALVSGEAKSVNAALIQAGFNRNSTCLRDRLAPGGDLRRVLETQLEEAGLTLPVILDKLRLKLDASKIVKMTKNVTTGESEAITADDNDAQLNAVAQTLRLHERTGKLPALVEQGPSTGTITVNVLVMGDNTQS
jgi:hypothetical protein